MVKSVKKKSNQPHNNKSYNQSVDLDVEYEKYIDYLLNKYGKEEYPDPDTYKHHERVVKCMADKCKSDIINYLDADIKAEKYRRTCKSPFDKLCIKTIKNKYNPRDKFAKLTSCKTNKCITKKQMHDAWVAYLNQEPTQKCMVQKCDKAVADFRANKILMKETIKWQCNKDNQTQYKQDVCAVKQIKRMLKNKEHKNMQRMSNDCFHAKCISV